MSRVSVRASDIELVADVAGSDFGRTVLFLHAGGETRDVWTAISERISLDGWRSIAPDLRGHGDSGRPKEYLLDEFVSDAELLVRELAGEPVVVVGPSLGGVIGLLLAGECRCAVAGLVLLDLPTAPAPAVVESERAKVVRAHKRRSTAVKDLDLRFVEGPFVDEVLANLDRWRRAAQSIRVPTLLIRGSRSQAIGERELELFLHDLPDAEVVTLEAGHLLARAQPGTVAQHLISFLRRLS